VRVQREVAYASVRPTWAIFTIRLEDANEAEIVRAERMFDATILAIEDAAPLFAGPAPLNTNQSDIARYTERTK